MNKLSLIYAALAAQACLCLIPYGARAQAVTLPAAVYGEALGGLGQHLGPGHVGFAGAGTDPTFGGAYSFAMNATALPGYIAAQVDTSCFHGTCLLDDGYQATASEGYFFDLVGPSSFGVVPINVTYSIIGSGILTVDAADREFGSNGPGAGLISFPTLPGQFFIKMIVNAEAGIPFGPAPGLNHSFGSVDPHIFIDPSFATTDPSYQNDFSILLSPGIPNGEVGVPEPATWALLLAGFACLGGAMRWRSRRLGSRFNAQERASALVS